MRLSLDFGVPRRTPVKGSSQMTKISLETPVRDLVNAHPDIVAVMVAMGLDGVTDPKLLNTVGRFMTLAKGAKMKHIAIEDLTATLAQAGFEVNAHE